MTRQILCGDALEELRKLPSCSIRTCITRRTISCGITAWMDRSGL